MRTSKSIREGKIRNLNNTKPRKALDIVMVKWGKKTEI